MNRSVLAAAALIVGIRASAAPPVPDPSAGPNAPKVETAANGTPVVQIANPSAAGVSRNQFTRFDVDSGGLILNNSKTLTATQLAGWITANPNLSKSASVILNEVTGGDPSQLLGYLEVAGPMAEVVIANPNGITCNGCGFINVSRGTLTTGTPIFGGSGSLDSFRVAGGTISIEGAGLDGRRLDRAAIIARAIRLNAGLWTKQLDVVTGANLVDRTSLTATPIAGTGAAPIVSIDVGALGGMYAGTILLVGTERGVGVTSAGTLASEGEFRLESNGDVVLRGPTTSVDAMAIRARSVDTRGTLYSSCSLRIDAEAGVSTAGVVGARGDLTVQADRITVGGLVGAGLTPEAQVTAPGSISLTATNGIAASAQQLVSGGAITIDGAMLDLAGATVQGAGSIKLTARAGGIDLSRAQLDAGTSLGVTASGGDVLATNGTSAAQGAITVSTSGLFDNTQGLVIGNDVQITAREIRSQGDAAIVAARDVRLYAASALLNADGSIIYAGGDLTIAGAPSAGSGTDPVAAGSVLNRSGQIEAGRDLTVFANELRNEKSVYEVSYDASPVVSDAVTRTVLLADVPPGTFDFVDDGWDTSDKWSDKSVVTQTETYVPVVVADSASAQLRAGGNVALVAGNVLNDQSVIAAGNSILDQGVSYTQPAIPGNRVDTKTWYSVIATQIDSCNGTFDIGCETSHTHTKRTFSTIPVVTDAITETLPSTSQRLENTGAGPDAPGVSSRAPQIALPTSRLFTVHPDSGGRYLVETDPRFTKLGKFISSDYLLGQLPVHPDLPPKRLGDGFYEERVVMDELLRATGTPYLPGFGDALTQYRALMDQGLINAQKFNLKPGIALSAEQVAQLTLPMVWMVTVRVNGQDVLAPKVYVPSGSEVALSRGGSVVAGSGLTWKLSGNLDAAGRVAAGKDLNASAAEVRSSGGTFTAGGDARLDARNTVQLDAATIAAAGNVAIRAQSGDVAMGTAQTHAAKDGTLVTSAAGTVVVAGGDIVVRSGNDVRLTASALQGAGGVDVSAGRDLTLATANLTTLSGTVATGHLGTVIQSTQGSVRLVATRDASLQAAQIGAAGDVLIGAGGTLSLTAANDSVRAATNQRGTITRTYDETARGTVAQAGGAITLAALDSTGEGENQGRVRLEGAVVQAGGQLSVVGQDIQVADAREEHDSVVTRSWSKRGFLSKTKTTTRDEVNQDLSVGSLLSGGSVLLQSEGDLLVQGSQVVGQGDVALRAVGDIRIVAGEDRVTEKHEKKVVRTGLLEGDALGMALGTKVGVAVGIRKEKTKTDIDSLSHTRAGEDGTITTVGSTIGSVDGSIVIDAQRNVDTRGSDVTAKGDVSITGEDVLVDSVYDTSHTHTTVVVTQDGLSAGASNPTLDAAYKAYQAGNRAMEVKDERLKALYALRAARELQHAAQAAKVLAQQKDSRGVTIHAGVGHSESRNESTTDSRSALGSSVIADGNVSIVARGAPAQEHGDITVVGSVVKGGSVTLDAARDLQLLSAENRLDTSTDSLNWSVSIGVSATYGGKSKSNAGITASASVATTDEDSHDVSHTETQIQSAGATALRSGRDTTLRGAIVTGDSIAAAVGRDLRLESEQDRSTYHSTDLSASGQVQYNGSWSASLTLGYGGTESSYKSVQQQTGLFAATGGYDVRVVGNTDLRGAVIASSAEEARNQLDTGSLTFSNLENESKYSSVSGSLTIAVGAGGGVSPSIGPPVQGDKRSTTYAAVSPGSIVVRGGPTDLSGLSRDTANATNAIGDIFDKAKVAEQKELVQIFGEEAFKGVGDLAQHYTKPYEDAQLKEEAAKRYQDLLAKGDNLSGEEAAERGRLEDVGFRPDNVDRVLDEARAAKQQYQAQYDRWKDGSELKTALHAAVGALQASLGGGSVVAGGVGAGASERLSEVTARLPPSLKPYASLIIGAAAAKLTGANGLGAITGGAVADAGAKFNRDLHESEVAKIKEIAKHWRDYPFFDSEQDAIEQLVAAGCYMVHCAAGRPQDADTAVMGVVEDSRYLERDGKRLDDARRLLEQAAADDVAKYPGLPPMFRYTDWDASRDADARALAERQPGMFADKHRVERTLQNIKDSLPCLTGGLSPNDPRCSPTYGTIGDVPVVGSMFKGNVQPWIGILTGDDPWTLNPDCGEEGCLGLPQIRWIDGSPQWTPMSVADPTREGYAHALIVNGAITIGTAGVGLADPALANVETFIPLKPGRVPLTFEAGSIVVPGRGTAMVKYDPEFAVSQMDGYVVSVYNETTAGIIIDAPQPTLGPPTGTGWFGPGRLQFEADSVAQININAGAPGSLVISRSTNTPVYGTFAPADGLPLRVPTAADAGANIHFWPGAGQPRVVGPDFVIQPPGAYEWVVPGSTLAPPGTIVMRFDPKSGWIPVKVVH